MLTILIYGPLVSEENLMILLYREVLCLSYKIVENDDEGTVHFYFKKFNV